MDTWEGGGGIQGRSFHLEKGMEKKDKKKMDV